MSAYYDLYETPSPNGSEEKNLSMPVYVLKKLIPKRVCRTRCYVSASAQKHYRGGAGRLHRRTVRPACQRQHCRTRRVGIFSTSLKCTQDTDDEKKKIRSESVRFQNVHLRISNTFRKKIRQRMKLERTHSPTKKSKKTETTEETRKERLMLFLQENVCITKTNIFT